MTHAQEPALTMMFRKALPEITKKTGCTGFLRTDSALTGAQLDLIKRAWARGFGHDLCDGEKIVILESS